MVKRAVVRRRPKKSLTKKRRIQRRSKRKSRKFNRESLPSRVSPDSTSAQVDAPTEVSTGRNSEMDEVSEEVIATISSKEITITKVHSRETSPGAKSSCEDIRIGSNANLNISKVVEADSNVDNNISKEFETDNSLILVPESSNSKNIKMDESVICLDSSATTEFDSSVFIIDVEPSKSSEVSLLLNFANNNAKIGQDIHVGKSYAERGGREIGNYSNTPSGNLLSSGSSKTQGLDTTCVLVSSNDSLSDASDVNINSYDDDSDLNPNSYHGNSNHSNTSTGSANIPQTFAAINSIVDEMKKDGFLNQLSMKRKFRGNNCSQNKRFHSSDDSNSRNWDLYKRTKRSVNSPQKPRSAETSPNNPECRSTLRVDNSPNLEDENCIPVDDNSDSDVEFVEAFNPQDKMIELSDSEDSVVMEDASPPLVIRMPQNVTQRKRQKRKQNKNEVTSTTPETSKVKKRNPKKKVSSSKPDPATLRPIVIDGCNVAMGHSRSKVLSVAGLKICYDYFKSRGHEVKIFLPQSRKYHPMTSDPPLLDKMEKEGIVIFTPSRRVDGKLIGSYDDRFILEFASLKGAIVVTRDNYRDLYSEREDFRDTIKNRLLQYTFIDNLIMFPQDPLGRTGPNLSEFLKFPDKEKTL